MAEKFRDGSWLKHLVAIPIQDTIIPEFIKLGNKDWRLRHVKEPDFDEAFDQLVEEAPLQLPNKHVDFTMRALFYAGTTAFSDSPKKVLGRNLIF